jgi:hypothetical protein
MVVKLTVYLVPNVNALVFKCFDFAIRFTISLVVNQRSRGFEIVYSVPLKYFTAWLMESFQGTICGYRL